MPTPVAAPARANIRDAIAAAAARSGVDFDYLYGQARIESALDPSAKARTSSATGLFQFTRGTWLATLDRHGAAHGMAWAADAIVADGGRHRVADAGLRDAILGLRHDVEASSQMAAAFAADNRDYLESNLGHAVEPVDLYLAHFLGPAGALRFLRAHDADPDQSAAALLPDAAAPNRAIFYGPEGPRSLRDVRDRFAAKLGDGGAPPASNRSVTTARTERAAHTTQRSLSFLPIEPMPRQLSPDFVARAYARFRESAS